MHNIRRKILETSKCRFLRKLRNKRIIKNKCVFSCQKMLIKQFEKKWITMHNPIFIQYTLKFQSENYKLYKYQK